MTTPYLTDDEVADITAPLTQGAARVKFFQAIGVPAKRKPNGQPLVWRADFEAAQASRPRGPGAGPPPAAEDWSGLEQRQRRNRRPAIH